MGSAKKYLTGTLEQLYRAADKELSAGRVDGAMVAVSSAARILYAANYTYTDEKFEALLAQITQCLPVPAPREQKRSE